MEQQARGKNKGRWSALGILVLPLIVGLLLRSELLSALALTFSGLLIGAMRHDAALQRRPGIGRGARAVEAVNSFGGVAILILLVWGVAFFSWQRKKAETHAADFAKNLYTGEWESQECADLATVRTGRPAAEAYAEACKTNGPVTEWHMIRTGSQALGTPAIVEVRVQRSGKWFTETWYFNLGGAFWFTSTQQG